MEKSPDNTHPSYGMIAVNRFTIGGTKKTPFFGSSLDTHYSGIRIVIKRAVLTKYPGSSRVDHPFARESLIEVDLTGAQFAELITAMNVGDGVPCTIKRIGGEGIPEPPAMANEAEKVREDIKTDVASLAVEARELLTALRSTFDGKNIKKVDRQVLIKKTEAVIQNLESNLPYLLTRFEEATEKTVVRAKAEIETFMRTTLEQAGLEALKLNSQNLLVDKTPSDTVD
jgi:hypothetical protein